jgi:hypothetical protein
MLRVVLMDFHVLINMVNRASIKKSSEQWLSISTTNTTSCRPLKTNPYSTTSFIPVFCSSYSSTLKIESICSSEISVGLQRTTRLYTQGDSILHNHRCDSLKSCTMIINLLHLVFRPSFCQKKVYRSENKFFCAKWRTYFLESYTF